ncbi:hypothetical protein WA158_001260 [Blastocystis sp. Blastoise]
MISSFNRLLGRVLPKKQFLSQLYPRFISTENSIDGEGFFPDLPLEEYKDRQRLLLSNLPPKSSIIVTSSSIKYMSWNIPYEYRQNANFNYLCGILEPNMVLLLSRSSEKKLSEVDSILFMSKNQNSPDNISNQSFTSDDIKSNFQISEVYDLKEMPTKMSEYISKSENIYTSISDDSQLDDQIQTILKSCSNSFKVESLIPSIESLRWRKTPAEQKHLRHGGMVNVAAFLDVMERIQIGNPEYMLNSIYEFGVKARGGTRMAYPPFIASGNNRCSYTYQNGKHHIQKNDTLLLDFGCELNSYSTILCRMKRFVNVNDEEKVIYDALQESYKQLLSTIQLEECSLASLQDQYIELITKLLIHMKIIKSTSLQQAIQQQLYKPFFPHFISLLLLLLYYYFILFSCFLYSLKSLYFPPDDSIPKQFHNIGVRLKDTYIYSDKFRVENLTQRCDYNIVDSKGI